MLNKKSKQMLDSSRESAKFFEVEVTIKIFGHTIWHFRFPPENDSQRSGN